MKNVQLQHTVSTESKEYLQDYLKKNLMEHFQSGNAAKKAIKSGLVLVNDVVGRTNTLVSSGDAIQILASDEQKPKAFDLPIDVLFEDDHLAVIHKPAGVPVSGNKYRTIQNAIIDQLTASVEDDKLSWPKPVHRLDEPTSGILLVAKTKKAQLELSRQFAEREIQKTYHALSVGSPSSNVKQIDLAIDSKAAVTEIGEYGVYESRKFNGVTLFKVKPLTGRKHQIRIHLASIDCPIMGDREHGSYKTNYFQKGLFLCATEISFVHPHSNELLTFKIDIPRKFMKFLDKLSKQGIATDKTS